MLKEDFRDFAAKTEIMNYSQTYADNLTIAAVEKDAQVNRTLMSQAADSMLEIKGVEASFVIARINEG